MTILDSQLNRFNTSLQRSRSPEIEDDPAGIILTPGILVGEFKFTVDVVEVVLFVKFVNKRNVFRSKSPPQLNKDFARVNGLTPRV